MSSRLLAMVFDDGQSSLRRLAGILELTCQCPLSEFCSGHAGELLCKLISHFSMDLNCSPMITTSYKIIATLVATYGSTNCYHEQLASSGACITSMLDFQYVIDVKP